MREAVVEGSHEGGRAIQPLTNGRGDLLMMDLISIAGRDDDSAFLTHVLALQVGGPGTAEAAI